jgi:hypothetical protein
LEIAVPWPKGKPNPNFVRGPGRPKGRKNKINVSFREATMQVFRENGGTKWFASWAKGEPTEFFKIAARLIPTEITGPNGEALRIVVEQIDSREPRTIEHNEQEPANLLGQLLS